MIRQLARRRSSALTVALAAALFSGGCATFYNDQVLVPGSGQRLAVGRDHNALATVWVLEDGKREVVRVVKK